MLHSDVYNEQGKKKHLRMPGRSHSHQNMADTLREKTLQYMVTEVNEETVDRFYRALLPLQTRSPDIIQQALEREQFIVDRKSIRCKGNGSVALSYMTRRYAYDSFDVVVHVVGGKVNPTGRGTQEPVVILWTLTSYGSQKQATVDFLNKTLHADPEFDKSILLFLQNHFIHQSWA